MSQLERAKAEAGTIIKERDEEYYDSLGVDENGKPVEPKPFILAYRYDGEIISEHKTVDSAFKAQKALKNK